MADFFTPETGQGFQAFGAALSGNLPAFRQTQALQRQEQRDIGDERKQALAVDIRGVRRQLEANNTQGAVNLLQDRIGRISDIGGDPTNSAQLLQQIQSGDIEGALSEATRFDDFAVDSGLLEAFPVAPKRDIEEDVFGIKRFVDTGEPVFADVTAEGIPKKVVVKASEILPDGTTIQSTSEGVRVFSAQGQRLSGNDVVEAIERANRLGVTLAGDTAAAKAASAQVTQSIQLAGDAFKKIGPIRQSLLTISKARRALAEGAETGVIDKFLPDIRESSIILTNLLNQLGLEVISGATFGALSAGELRLALDTALPTGLQPEALDRWLADKEIAQTKLLEELEGDVISLSSGTQTIADIVLARRNQQELSIQPQTQQPSITPEESRDAARAALGL